MADEKKGLPFTIDHRQMFEKTMESRFKSPFHDLEEATKLALENASSYVSINERRSGFSIEFDGGSVDSQEGLIKLVRNLYSDNSEDMGRLGTAVASALSNRPDSVSLTTPCEEGGSLHLEMEGMAPRVEPLDEKVESTHFQIRRKNRKTKEEGEDCPVDVADNFFMLPFKYLGSAVMHPRRAWNSLTKGERTYHKPKFEELVRYSTLEVTYNGEKLRTGLNQEDAIFEETYTFDDATVNLGVSKTAQERKMIFVRNGVRVGAHLSEFVLNEPADASVPDIIIESPYLSTNISDELILDSAYEKAVFRVKEAIDTFRIDYLEGKFPMKSSVFTSTEEIVRARFENDTLCNLIGSEDIKDAIKKRIGGEDVRGDGFEYLDRPIFEDLWGKYYSLAEAYSRIRDNDFTYYVTENNAKPSHPAVNLEKGAPAFHVKSNSHRRLIDRVVEEMQKYEDTTVDRSELQSQPPVISHTNVWNLDRCIMEYTKGENEASKEDSRNKWPAVTKGLNLGGKVAGAAGLCVGGYLTVPYAISAVQWTGISAAANPAITAAPFLALGAGYGVYKSAPYVKKGVGKSLGVIGKGIGSAMETTTKALPQKGDSAGNTAIEGANKEGEGKEQEERPKVSPVQGPLRDTTEEEKEYFENLIRILSTGPLGRSLDTLYNMVSIKNEDHQAQRVQHEYNMHSIIPTNENGKKIIQKAVENKKEGHILDVSSEDFKERAKRAKEEGGGSLYTDIDDIITTLFGSNSIQREALIATMYRDTANSIFDEFTEDSEVFRQSFPAFPSDAREYVLRRILQEGASGPHDTWLEKHYPFEIEQAAHYVMRDTYVNTYSELELKEQKGMQPWMQVYTTLTPQDVEGMLERVGPSREAIARRGIEEILDVFKVRDSESNQIACLFPVESSGFVFRKKKEGLDEAVDQYFELGEISPAVASWVKSSADWNYLYSRKLALLYDDEKGIEDITNSDERISTGMQELINTRHFELSMLTYETLKSPSSVIRGIESPGRNTVTVANRLLANHMLQPAGQAVQFKGYLRNNFLHNQAYILYSAIQEAYPDVITNR